MKNLKTFSQEIKKNCRKILVCHENLSQMASYVTDTLPEKYHKALLDWQKKNFPDFKFLLEHWSDYYRQEPFRLIAKIGEVRKPIIEVGKYQGREKFKQAREMDEEMLTACANIIRAQASTELGSIQQHRESLHKAQDPKMQFDVLRVMAEEFRHAYQMVYVLASDDWTRGQKNLADEVVEELLSMQTGSHVLEAFNLYFDSFVDNVVFAALIDRVGKYQLSMQTVFAYEPMARSMPPMLVEEAFHIASGINPLKVWVAQAAREEGNVSIPNIQKHINKWFPRGLEMFGDERGGTRNVEFGFKPMKNAEAQELYINEVQKEVIDVLNAVFITTRHPNMEKREAIELANRILMTGEKEQGISPSELLVLPSVKFFRRRGMHAFVMSDLHGNLFTNEKDYVKYLRENLPDPYVTGPDFAKFLENLKRHREGEEVKEEKLPFYG
jgi:benzoyl-CoA 2,3-dioxygenase component B